MKHLLSLATIAVVTLFLNGCKQEQEIELERTQPVANIDPHRIPREQAIAELNSLLDVIDADNITRGGAPRRIKEVIPVLADNCLETTRMSEDEAAAAIDTLLYLVNFEDENGYAVLSATEYLAPILAVTDSGSTDPKDWLTSEIAGYIWDFDCCVLDDDNEDKGDDEEDDPKIAFPILPKDSLINLNPEIGGSSAGYPDVTRAATVDGGNHEFEFVRRTIYDYCEFIMIDRQEDLGNGGGGNSGGGNSGGGNSGSGNSGGGNNGNTDPAPDPAEWRTLAQVQPMLQTIWNQKYPFNMYCPSKNNADTEYMGHAPAGCVAVALGQIIAYNRYPEKIENRTYDWDQIATTTIYSSLAAQSEVARLLATIGSSKYLKLSYGTNSSGGTADNAYETLKNLGYKHPHKYCGYKESTILTFLDSDRPFYIGAKSPKKYSYDKKGHGHAWVIDGYIKRQRGNQTEVLVHCNMGWSGKCNGYYSSGIFDTTQIKDEDGSQEEGAENNNRLKFCKYYRFLKYDKPNTTN